MRCFLNTAVLFAALMCVAGCQSESAPVAETEDEFAAYDRMIAEDQAQTAADSEQAE